MTDRSQLTRLPGQELSSVLVATNSVRLEFVKYPLLPSGEFTDTCVIEIEHGFDVASDGERRSYRSADSMAAFREGAFNLVRMIESVVVEAQCSPEGDLLLHFAGERCIRIVRGDDGFDGFAVHMN